MSLDIPEAEGMYLRYRKTKCLFDEQTQAIQPGVLMVQPCLVR
jgi:hypothetical protein